MKQAGTPRSKGIGALELIEEATFLLRRAPVEVLALYYLGTLPFMMGALYFWADMSRNADAGLHLPVASLGLALLFVWMKYWQSRFCGGLSRLLLSGSATPSATEIAVAQAAFQSLSLPLLPLALLVTLPFGWCLAFFQNVTVIGGGPDLCRVYDAARRQALLWQGQNHLLIGIFFLLGLVVFANLCILAWFFPRILKTLFGMESLFTRSNLFLLNSTFWVAMAALTHICIDPLIKGCYLLRCHYGESLTTGADLLAELRGAKSSSGTVIAVLALALSLLITGTHPAMASAASAGTTASSPVVSAQKLDRTIEQVISGPEFAWRLPRSTQQKGELPGFVRSAVELVGEWCANAWRLIKRFFKWLSEILPKITPMEERGSSGFALRDYVFPLIYGLLALFLSLGGVSLWRQIRRRREREPEAVTPALVMEPDLRDENVMADELSQERWSALAGDLLAKGELRLGMRALYLACLSFLAQERLIAIARYKSNRDYERELARFSHTLPQVAASFSSNMAMFERAWYGVHLPEPGMVETFTANYERIVSGVRKG
jgi:hypothetical protein